MFKKLKQKLEEGGENNGLEKITFSPNKLPGSILRSNSHNEEKAIEDGKRETGSISEYELPHSDKFKLEQEKGELPNHLMFHPSTLLNYQSTLEGKVNELERECSRLDELLCSESDRHIREMASAESHAAELDRQLTELKMKVVEYELEKAEIQLNQEKECQKLEDKLRNQEELFQEYRVHSTDQISQLKHETEKKDKCIIEAENKCSLLEKKVNHLESQIKGYERSSENVVVSRLHYEVADVEQRVQSRNLEIQILERRLAAQAKEKENDIDKLLNKLEELEKKNRDTSGEVKEGKSIRRELLHELEINRQMLASKEREKESVIAKLSAQIKEHQRLLAELDHLQSEHTKQLQERDTEIEGKNNHIRDLLHQFKQLRGENVLIGPLSHPPGVARRTACIGVQTHFHEVDLGIAVLPLKEEEEEEHANKIDHSSGGPATMKSLTSEDALEVMKQEQSQLEGEVAEKNKIIKVQQQKIMDIRKELRLQKPSVFIEDKRQANSTPSPPPSGIPDVNFLYLKHVVIKFMCSREDEALQLIRAISTLLEFSPQEEQHVINYLNYKMSWFGVIPPPLFTPIKN